MAARYLKQYLLSIEEAIGGGYVKPEVIFVDATHVKANANRKKRIKNVPAAVIRYEKQLHAEVNEGREFHGTNGSGLNFAAMNLKKLALWRSRLTSFYRFSSVPQFLHEKNSALTRMP